NRPAFFGRRREGGVRDELLQVSGRNPQRLLELHRRETRKLALRQAQQLELRPSALERDALITRRGNLDRRRRQLARDLGKFSRGNRDRAGSLDVSDDLGAYGDVEIGSGDPDSLLGRLHEKVGQDWKGRLGRNGRCDRCQALLEFLTRDGETHSLPEFRMRRMWIPRLP